MLGTDKVLLLSIIILTSDVKRRVFGNAEITAYVGDNILLTCDILKSDDGIHWYFNGKNVVARQNNLTRPRIIQNGASLLLTELTFGDSGVYACGNSNETSTTTLTVGTSPDQPKDLTCKTHYSLSNMTCCWNVGKYPGIVTNFTLRYVIRTMTAFSWIYDASTNDLEEVSRSCVSNQVVKSSSSALLPSQCCTMPLNEKSWEAESRQVFVIRMESRNMLGTKTSPNITERPLAWIDPIPPYNVKVNVEQRDHVYNLAVNWEKPDMKISNFEYKIRYRISSGNDNGWHVQRRIMQNFYEFELMRSHSLVEVQVAAWPTGRYGGYWSEWSKSAFNRTGISLPTSTFRYVDVISDLSEDGLVITVQWIPYGRPDEPGFHYELCYLDCRGRNIASRNISAYESSFRLAINSTDIASSCVQITGAHCNTGGCSERSTKIIEILESKYRWEIQFSVSSAGYNVSWTPKVDFAKSRTPETCLVKILGIIGSRDDPAAARRLITSRKVMCNLSTVALLQQPSPCMDYISYVSSWSSSAGIVYTETSKSEILDAPEFKMDPFDRFIVTTGITAQLSVRWSTSSVNCSHLRPYVFFTATNGSECAPASETCNQEFMSEPLKCTASYANITSQVYGDTSYEVRYGMCCPVVSSLHMPKCFFPTLAQAKTIRTPVTAPSVPLNFQWGTNGMNILSWEKPLHQNGPLTDYNITVRKEIYDISEVTQNFTTSQSRVSLTRLCQQENIGEELQVVIRACNKKVDGGILCGDPAKFQPIACTASRVFHKSSVVVIMAIIISTIVVLISASLAYCHKQHIKNILIRTIWPTIPRPNILVTLQAQGSEGNNTGGLELLSLNEREFDAGESSNIDVERCDDIRMPLISSSQPTCEQVKNEGMSRGNTETHELSDVSEEEQDTLVLQEELIASEGCQMQLKSSRSTDMNSSNSPLSLNSQDLNERTEDLLHISRNSGNLYAKPQNAGCRRRSLDADSGHVSYSFLSSTSPAAHQHNSNEEKTVVRRMSTETTLTLPTSQTIQPNEGNMYERSPVYGSTPSLPSYLSCTSYSLGRGTNPSSNYSGLYTGVTSDYQWTLPEYTRTRYLADNLPYGFPDTFQSTPLELRPDRINFFVNGFDQGPERQMGSAFVIDDYAAVGNV